MRREEAGKARIEDAIGKKVARTGIERKKAEMEEKTARTEIGVGTEGKTAKTGAKEKWERLAGAWRKVVKRFPEANMLQSPKYGEMNELLGDVSVVEEFEGRGWALMIVRDAKRGRYLEIPCGPLIDWGDTGVVQEMIRRVTEVAKEQKCVFVRMRPQLLASAENLALLEGLGLKKSPMHLAAEHTVMIDLSPGVDELLAKMRRQTRYDVRKAGRLGMTVEKRRDEAIFREFHEVQLETAKRQGFVPPNLETLLAEREAFLEDIAIYVARTGVGQEGDVKTGTKQGAKAKTGMKQGDDAKTDVEQGESVKTGAKQGGERDAEKCGAGRAVAYGLILKAGQEGDYYEAASTELNRRLPGADAVLWQAMQDLKAEGYQRFNLWGIAPEGEPKHRYAGVTTFKKGFGGEVIEYVPAHDLVISHAKYAKNWVVETARRKRRHL